MKLLSLASSGFEKDGRATKRSVFLAEMDRVVPWSARCALIAPVYPQNEVGRPPVGLERMRRIHFLPAGFNRSDPAVEEALYDAEAMRQFVGIDRGVERAPDETTIGKCRHLLTKNPLGKKVLARVNEHLNPERHQTRKGNPWYVGMKAPVEAVEKPGNPARN